MGGTSTSVTTTTTSGMSQTVVTDSGNPYQTPGAEIVIRHPCGADHQQLSATLLALTDALRVQSTAIESLAGQVAALARGEEALAGILARLEALEKK